MLNLCAGVHRWIGQELVPLAVLAVGQQDEGGVAALGMYGPVQQGLCCQGTWSRPWVTPHPGPTLDGHVRVLAYRGMVFGPQVIEQAFLKLGASSSTALLTRSAQRSVPGYRRGTGLNLSRAPMRTSAASAQWLPRVVVTAEPSSPIDQLRAPWLHAQPRARI